jgi:amidohydrolase
MKPDEIRSAVETRAEEAIAFRRELHRYPELSGQEVETARRIVEKLEKLGIEVTTPFGDGHGVRGIIEGDAHGRVVLLRADMDALPVTEETGLPFASEVPGMMHACGHDVHSAILWLAASVLTEYRDKLPGRVVLMFQPHEERLPGGAPGMIEAGILRDPKVDFALAVHTDPSLPAGEIGLREGALMARPDDFTITVRGVGGHAAHPQSARDPIVAASAVVLALQQVVSRRLDPIESGVVSVCTIQGGASHNVIPDHVLLRGTVRSLRVEIADLLQKHVSEIAEGVARAHGCTTETEWVQGYPPLVNSGEVIDAVRKTAAPFAKLIQIEKPLMGGEDFSYVCREVPGALVRLGSGHAEEDKRVHWHHPAYFVDEDAIPIGACVMVAAALELLSGSG